MHHEADKNSMNLYWLFPVEQKLINKRTENEPSQFGSSRERIAAANTENLQCNTTENVERVASKNSPLTV